MVKKSISSKGLNKPKGYDIEADGFSDLCITPQSQGLQALFFAQTATKKNPYRNPRPVKQVRVHGVVLFAWIACAKLPNKPVPDPRIP